MVWKTIKKVVLVQRDTWTKKNKNKKKKKKKKNAEEIIQWRKHIYELLFILSFFFSVIYKLQNFDKLF